LKLINFSFLLLGEEVLTMFGRSIGQRLIDDAPISLAHQVSRLFWLTLSVQDSLLVPNNAEKT
jgi:hypothetical protein